MLKRKINDYLYYIGVNDRETELFENQWPLENGITYNSYLLNTEKTCLMDTVKITKLDEFKENLNQALDGKDLDYLVIHHMEPDHSGSIENILKSYPNVKLVGNKKTKELLYNFYGIEDNFLEVNEGESLDLGNKKLTFYKTPMVHWPESMVSFIEEDGILFSQDAFGSYKALSGQIFDDEINWKDFEYEAIRYYVNIVAKYSKMLLNALKKLDKLDIKTICPVHGCVWRKDPNLIINLYKKLANQEVREGVSIVYGTMYGNTRKIAEYFASILNDEGIKNIELFDVSKTHFSHLMTHIYLNRGIVLGSCTYDNKLFPNMKHLLWLMEENKLENHSLSIFENYSWSGGALKELKAYAESSKLEVFDDNIRIQSSPKEEDFIKIKELAKKLAKNIKSFR